MWDFILTYLSICWLELLLLSCTLSILLWVHRCISPSTVVLDKSIWSRSYNLPSIPLFYINLYAFKEKYCDINIIIRVKHSRFSYHLIDLWIFLLIVIYCKYRPDGWRLSDAMTYAYNNNPLGVVLMSGLFNKIVAIHFRLWPLFTCHWLTDSVMYRFYLLERF